MIRHELSVNDLLRHRPGALPVLAAAGIDTCCGGAESLERAAAAAGIAWTDLLTRLEAAPEPPAATTPAPSCGCGCRHD